MTEIDANIVAGHLTTWMGIPITNGLLMGFVVVILLVLIAFLVRRRIKLMPSKIQLFFELVVQEVFSYVSEVLESETLARRFFPLVITIFLFIFTANMVEFIPGVGSIGYYAHSLAASGAGNVEFIPLLRSLATDLNMPLALAIVSFLVTEIAGIVTIGFFRYMKRFFNFRSVIGFIVGIIEFVSEWVRLVTFSFRLFGNIFAGDVLISVATFFIPFVIPVPFIAFEVFVGFIQAAIFALLTLFFIKLAVTEPVH